MKIWILHTNRKLEEDCLISLDYILDKYDLYRDNIINNVELRKLLDRFIFQYNSIDECEKKLLELLSNNEKYGMDKIEKYYLFITNIIKEICHIELIPIIYNKILQEKDKKDNTFIVNRQEFLKNENKKESEEDYKIISGSIYKKYILVLIKILYHSYKLSYNYQKNLITSISYICILMSKYDTVNLPHESIPELIYRIFWKYFSQNFNIINETFFTQHNDEIVLSSSCSSSMSSLSDDFFRFILRIFIPQVKIFFEKMILKR
ncbi:hypothetical protein PFLG_00865, partial [Plasmodium falciparum RAJ116]